MAFQHCYQGLYIETQTSSCSLKKKFFLDPSLIGTGNPLRMGQQDQPVVGVPYYAGQNPYQAGAIPPNAIVGDPKGIPIQQTMYRDTPAPFNCVYCGNSGVTFVR